MHVISACIRLYVFVHIQITPSLSTLLGHVGHTADAIPRSLVPYTQIVIALGRLTHSFETLATLITNEVLSTSVESARERIHEMEPCQFDQTHHVAWQSALDSADRKSEGGWSQTEILSVLDSTSLCLPTSSRLCPKPLRKSVVTAAGVNFYFRSSSDIDSLISQLSISREAFWDFSLQGYCPPLISVTECIGRTCISIPADWDPIVDSSTISSCPNFSLNATDNKSAPASIWDNAVDFLIKRHISYSRHLSASLSKLNGIAPMFVSTLPTSVMSQTQDLLHHLSIPSLTIPQIPINSQIVPALFHPVFLIPKESDNCSGLLSPEFQIVLSSKSTIVQTLKDGSSETESMIESGMTSLSHYPSNDDESLNNNGGKGFMSSIFYRSPKVEDVLPNESSLISSETLRAVMDLEKNKSNQMIRILMWNSSDRWTTLNLHNGARLLRCLFNLTATVIQPEDLLKSVKGILQREFKLQSLDPATDSESLLNSVFVFCEGEPERAKQGSHLWNFGGVTYSVWCCRKEGLVKSLILIPIIMGRPNYHKCQDLFRRMRSVPNAVPNAVPDESQVHQIETTRDIPLQLVLNSVKSSSRNLTPHNSKSANSVIQMIKSLRKWFEQFEISQGFWKLFNQFALSRIQASSEEREPNIFGNGVHISDDYRFMIRCVSLELICLSLIGVLRFFSRCLFHDNFPKIPNLMHQNSPFI